MQIRLTDAHLVKEEKIRSPPPFMELVFGNTEVSADAISLRANALHNISAMVLKTRNPFQKINLTKRKFAHFSRAYKYKDLLIRTLKYLFFVFLNT